LATAADTFGALASITSGGNDKLLKLSKNFAAAEGLINAWRAHNQVLADPSLNFLVKIPAALAVLGAGLGAVNSLKGVSDAGGGTGVGAVAAGGGNVAQAPQPRGLAEFRVEGNNVRGLGALIDDINEAIDDGYHINIQYAG
jgi:hypothetical protein